MLLIGGSLLRQDDMLAATRRVVEAALARDGVTYVSRAQIKEVHRQSSERIIYYHVDGEANLEVRPFSGLLIDFARDCNATIIVRGLRAISDFEYEVQLAGMNRSLAPEIETAFLTAAQRYAFVSSSLVREIARLDGDVSKFLHPAILQRLTDKLQASR